MNAQDLIAKAVSTATRVEHHWTQALETELRATCDDCLYGETDDTRECCIFQGLALRDGQQTYWEICLHKPQRFVIHDADRWAVYYRARNDDGSRQYAPPADWQNMYRLMQEYRRDKGWDYDRRALEPLTR